MRQYFWRVCAITFAVLGLYYLSFFVILLGQRLDRIEVSSVLGLGYTLNYEMDPGGLHFYENPGMIIFRPLSKPVFETSSDPDAEVRLNVHGKLVMTAFYWGWAGTSLLDSWSNAAKQRFGTHKQQFPARFPEDR